MCKKKDNLIKTNGYHVVCKAGLEMNKNNINLGKKGRDENINQMCGKEIKLCMGGREDC